MSKRYWGYFVAIGLIALSGISIAQEDLQENKVDGGTTADQGYEQSTVEQPPLLFVLPADPSPYTGNKDSSYQAQEQANDHLWFGEGPAQWTMAIMSVLAAFLSGWAVILLNSTLRATNAAVTEAKNTAQAAQDTIEVTEKIGKSQTRAYLFVEKAEFVIVDYEVGIIKVMVSNAGNSPAKRITVSGEFIIDTTPGHEILAECNAKQFSAIAPQGTAKILIMNDANPSHATQRYGNRLGSQGVHVHIRIDWIDVFDDSHTQNFIFTEKLSSTGVILPIDSSAVADILAEDFDIVDGGIIKAKGHLVQTH